MTDWGKLHSWRPLTGLAMRQGDPPDRLHELGDAGIGVAWLTVVRAGIDLNRGASHAGQIHASAALCPHVGDALKKRRVVRKNQVPRDDRGVLVCFISYFSQTRTNSG